MLKDLNFLKGVNLGGWFSQCDYSKERLDNFIKEDDFKRISSWGLDHVRLPMDYNIFEDEEGNPLEDGFIRVDNAIENALKNNLNIVLDLHKTAGYSFDSGEKESGFFFDTALQERFYKLWDELSNRFGNERSHIVFELLNEVTDRSYIDKWNEVSLNCIKRIRENAKDTVILLGSYDNNSAKAVKDLNSPYDENVIYNFHCYEPISFTHQGAYWMDLEDENKRISFDESGATEEYFEDLFSSAIEKAKEEKSSLYCGEYGVIDIVSPEDTLSWYKVINKVFNKYDIPRAAWSYKEMDFGLSDSRMDKVRDELLKYL